MSAREFPAFMLNDALELTVVVRSAGGSDVIFGSVGGTRLKEFLQFALGIFQNRKHGQFAAGFLKMAFYERFRRGKPAVDEDGPDDSFLEGVRKGGRPFAPANAAPRPG